MVNIPILNKLHLSCVLRMMLPLLKFYRSVVDCEKGTAVLLVTFLQTESLYVSRVDVSM